MIDALHYENVIQTYDKLFGDEHVTVHVYEELKYNPERYIKKLAYSVHIDYEVAFKCLEDKYVNQRSGKIGTYSSDSRNLVELLSIYKKRFCCNRSFGLNKAGIINMLRKIYIPGRKIKNIFIPDEYIDKLNHEFSDSNRLLSKIYHLDLGKHNYFQFPYDSA
jgi:hypothetical protein